MKAYLHYNAVTFSSLQAWRITKFHMKKPWSLLSATTLHLTTFKETYTPTHDLVRHYSPPPPPSPACVSWMLISCLRAHWWQKSSRGTCSIGQTQWCKVLEKSRLYLLASCQPWGTFGSGSRGSASSGSCQSGSSGSLCMCSACCSGRCAWRSPTERTN